mgnify:FL=1
MSHRRRLLVAATAATLVGAALAGVAPAALEAQSYELGLGSVLYADYPEPFGDPYCSEPQIGLGGSAAWHALGWASLEASSTISFGGGNQCAIADFDLAPTPLDTPIDERRLEDGIRGGRLFESHLSVLFEPWRAAPVSPRGRIGYGRIWGKGLGEWVWGLGVRYRFGRHSMVTDLDWWTVGVPETYERVICPSSGGREVLRSQRVTQSYTPFNVRLGWEVSVGR